MLFQGKECNTPDVTFPICTPTLAVSGIKLHLFPRVRVFVSGVVIIVMHLISCHHVHCICIRVRLMHPSFFSRCPFCIPALRSPPVSLSTSFRVWVLNVFGLDRDLSCGLAIVPVDRLSSFGSFGLRLILQRLAEGPKRPRVCCSPTPLQFGPKPTKLCSIT